MTQKKVLVGLSGGVDSAVSAYLLKEQGYDVSAGFMINYLTEDDSCPTRTDMAVAKEVAEYLEIPFFTFDFIEEYEQRVLNYIFEGYKKGLTPNPDVFCNTWIKFDLFREEALSYGFDAVATGHYVRLGGQEKKEERRNNKVGSDEKNNKAQSIKHKEGISLNSPLEGEPVRPLAEGGTIGVQLGVSDNSELVTRNSSLLRGVDPDKDQSYFLAALSREQLEQAIFPIGNLPKYEVRAIARKAGLPNAERKDSQGLCFVGKVDFAEFLKAHIPAKKGNIVTTKGSIVGEHDGAFQYTIGQRKGIGVGGGPALYVVEKNVENNTIIVGEEDDPRLLSAKCIVGELNWLEDISLPLNCEAQIRYRQAPQKCTLTEIQNTSAAADKVHNEGINVVCPLDKGGENSDGNRGIAKGELAEEEMIEGIQGNPPGSPFIKGAGSMRNSSLPLGSDNPVNLGNPVNLSTSIEVSFEVPQRAITPGQVCVFYDGDTVLGSGIIIT